MSKQRGLMIVAAGTLVMLTGLGIVGKSSTTVGILPQPGEAATLTAGSCPATTTITDVCGSSCGVNPNVTCVTSGNVGTQDAAVTCKDNELCTEPQSITKCSST
jgi:hypothetical protein